MDFCYWVLSENLTKVKWIESVSPLSISAGHTLSEIRRPQLEI